MSSIGNANSVYGVAVQVPYVRDDVDPISSEWIIKFSVSYKRFQSSGFLVGVPVLENPLEKGSGGAEFGQGLVGCGVDSSLQNGSSWAEFGQGPVGCWVGALVSSER